MKFEPAGTFSEENLYKLIKASTGLYQWKSWCKEIIDSEYENWPIIQCLYNKENLIVKVVEINSFLFYIPKLPVEDMLADCQVTGDYEETTTKVVEFYEEVVLLTAERFKTYQAIFNSFVESAIK